MADGLTLVERNRLRATLSDEVGADRRGNAILMQHVMANFAGGQPLMLQTFADHEIFFDPRDDKIGMTLLSGREWQRRFLDRAVAALLVDERLEHGRAFIDVGANIGSTAIYAMRTGVFGQAIAFEPEPHNAAIFKRNMVANRLSDTVMLMEAAVGAEPGQVTLHLDARNFGRHSLNADAVATDAGHVAVNCVTVDGTLASFGLGARDVGLIKIDVEGAEASVLDGMPLLVTAGCPLVVEVTSGEGLQAWQALRERLAPGYRRVVDLDGPQMPAFMTRF